MLDADAFRERFPEFDEAKFPAPVVELRLALACEMFTAYSCKSEKAAEMMACLHTAHCLTVYGSRAAGGDGSAPATSGVISSKSVDGVSVSYDVGSSAEQGAGFYNSTSYGRELYRMMRVFGAGALYI